MSADDLQIVVGLLAGSGDPPSWYFNVRHYGAPVVQMSGPRLLVLETLGRWVALFEEESRPLAKPGVP